MDLVEDSRLEKEQLCRVTKMVGAHEFICILSVHAPPIKKGERARAFFNSRGKPEGWARHYFVRRYPMGDH